MKPFVVFAGMVCALMVPVLPARAAAPTVHRRTLPNGIRVCYLHLKDSANFSTFTFLPMGLAFDEADHTQWAHLIEHLVLRTTIPGPLTNANAETLLDHMRLDFYGTRDNWREGLSHHAKWLGGPPFSDASVRVEPAKANAEIAYATKSLALAKFATAAWNQVLRHGKDHAALKGDILKPDRKALEAYRDAHLVIPDRTLVCMIGAVEPDTVLAGAANALGAIKSTAKPAIAAQLKGAGVRPATWDVDARHILITYPIPGPDSDPAAHAALLAWARLLWIQFAQDAELQRAFGPVFVGVDLRCPESSYFYLSATCRPKADGAADDGDPGKVLADRLAELVSTVEKIPPAALTGLTTQLIAEMDPQDPAVLHAQAPPNDEQRMIETNLAIFWGTVEYWVGAKRDDVAAALRKVNVDQLRRIGKKYLAPDHGTRIELSPKRDGERGT